EGRAIGPLRRDAMRITRGGWRMLAKSPLMKFWEFPFGVEVEAPDSAMRELEELAKRFAGGNWGMEFTGTAMHFRFQFKNDADKFRWICMAHQRRVRADWITKDISGNGKP